MGMLIRNSASNTCSPRSRGRCDQLGTARRPGAGYLCYQFLENGSAAQEDSPAPPSKILDRTRSNGYRPSRLPGAERSRRRRKNHAADAHFFRHPAGMKRTGPPNAMRGTSAHHSRSTEIRRIAHHVRVDHEMMPWLASFMVRLELAQILSLIYASARPRSTSIVPQYSPGVELAQDEVGIGNGGVFSTQHVTGWPRSSPPLMMGPTFSAPPRR